jgi:ribosome maturation factor RimP
MSNVQGAKRQGSIAQKVWDIVLPTADELEYVLWDVEFVKEGADHYLRITIDHPEGITIEDCERMHRAIDPVLDEIDPIDVAYDLEVSSPGIERDLRTDFHIDACLGERVELRFFAPFECLNDFLNILWTMLPIGICSHDPVDRWKVFRNPLYSRF